MEHECNAEVLKTGGERHCRSVKILFFISFVDLDHLTNVNSKKSRKSPSESHLALEQGGGKHCFLLTRAVHLFQRYKAQIYPQR